MKNAPRGFHAIPRLSPFNALVGPLYERRRRGTELSIGLHVAYAMHAKGDGKAAFVTAHFAVDYAGAARLGDWIEAQVQIQRLGSRLAFANCYLVSGKRRIVRASAIFARADPQA
jgi:acyl-CoA thioesterase FadM